MRSIRNLIALSVAVLSVAAVAYVVIRHFDEVMRPVYALLRKLGLDRDDCDCDCDCCCDEEIFEVNSEE